jgi:hypothetical protein
LEILLKSDEAKDVLGEAETDMSAGLLEMLSSSASLDSGEMH